MKYRYSATDTRNLQWFANDMTRGSLVTMALRRGAIRGLTSFQMDFQYPVSVIAGTNGSGKSTLLALAACAFHNVPLGFRPRGRRVPYYTMSDFFVQSTEEVPVEGVTLRYDYLYSHWHPTATLPEGIGRGWQNRSKKRGGKWTNYVRRPKRDVAFFGIERVVPHSERSVSKSYRARFDEAEEEGYEDTVRDAVGRILGRSYDSFWFREHSKYRLPHVQVSETIYSGFNMGAGENALFEILSTIYSAPPGLLVVVDELELGLHESAQRRFVDELKTICDSRHTQVICTTHSPTIISRIPPEGRFLVERRGDRTVITGGISPEYAAGRLADRNSQELDIYLEDGIAKDMVQAALPTDVRRRVNPFVIGSAAAVVRQMAARYRERKRGDCIAILDGDQRVRKAEHTRVFLKSLETLAGTGQEETEWFEARITFLPGDTWPEKWVFEQIPLTDRSAIARQLQVDGDELVTLSVKAVSAGKHNEFHTLACDLCMETSDLCGAVCRWLAEESPDSFDGVRNLVLAQLD